MKYNIIIYVLLILVTLYLIYLISQKTREGMKNKKYLLVNEKGAFLFGDKGPIQKFKKIINR